MDGSRSLSKILDRASHRALVTGEWYIPGQRLSGFRIDELASMGRSSGDEKVETTRIGDAGAAESIGCSDGGDNVGRVLPEESWRDL
ncbi:hypothetical protein MA16_Dca022244 [Dendrobium catenatum]|uniref:Uncharacterized protein n=1 Tax=Dendrobium catenatum TaxID=906689 RepID=A0A2I0X9U5_9ASPA|nr:hypothetical protein MA16_Dca022244 [Dendrobium catenatum]